MFRLPCLAIALLALGLTTSAEDSAADVLDEVNLARTQPAQYASILESYAAQHRSSDEAASVREAVSFLRRTRPVAPLAWSPGIGKAALSHALDVGPRGGRSHSGSRGSTPWRRMAQHGSWSGNAGENIDFGHGDARAIVVSLIIDHGVRSRAHRANLFNPQFRVAGIAVAPHAQWGKMCVMDFAGAFAEAGERRLVDRMGISLRSEYMGKSFY